MIRESGLIFLGHPVYNNYVAATAVVIITDYSGYAEF